jgi:acyl-CoA synthetase (AMP-forming)/AMP-acid ligase II
VSIELLLRNTANRYPTQPAITQGLNTITYSEFDARVNGFAQRLLDLGLSPGARVCVLMENRPEMLISYLAVFRSGACVVPLNARFVLDDVEYHIADSGASVLIHSDDYSDLASGLPSDVIKVCVDEAERRWLEPAPSTFKFPMINLSDSAWLFYTSGTTGRPKGATLTHSNLQSVVSCWLADLERLRVGDSILHVGPLTHGAGFHALAAVASGAHQVLLPGRFDPEEVLSLMAKWEIRGSFMVPTHIRLLTDAAESSRLSFPHLRAIIYGGAPILRSDLEEALDVFEGRLVQIYAQGETPMTATILRHRGREVPTGATDQQLHLSAGVPRLGTDVTVLRSDDSLADPGEPGEIVVRGPAVMSGYWERPEATAETLKHGWLHTGDLGRRDDQGFIYVLDRLKDMIITGGQNVYAREVEDVLGRCSGVTAVAVVGIPDRKWGEAVTAAVVRDPNGSLSEDDLVAFSSRNIAAFKRPKRFIFLPELPTSAYGKVLKRELRDQLARQS